MEEFRRAIRSRVHALVGSGDGAADGERPDGDQGLFGPGSACRRVHGDFTAMMIGGVSALLVQMLHPGALAGVWDHSDFRRDMPGRLRRTAQFISSTTYGPTDRALALVERVRGIHDRVHGKLPDGTRYAANDPALLTWVHASEIDSFLRAHLRYRDPAFPPGEQDRYCAEAATIARRLGATDLPETRRALTGYLHGMRGQLRVDVRTRTVAAALLSPPTPDPTTAPFVALLMEAGIDLLPDWAAAMHGFRRPLARRPAIRLGARGVGTMLRWALREGAAGRGTPRTGAGAG